MRAEEEPKKPVLHRAYGGRIEGLEGVVVERRAWFYERAAAGEEHDGGADGCDGQVSLSEWEGGYPHGCGGGSRHFCVCAYVCVCVCVCFVVLILVGMNE